MIELTPWSQDIRGVYASEVDAQAVADKHACVVETHTITPASAPPTFEPCPVCGENDVEGAHRPWGHTWTQGPYKLRMPGRFLHIRHQSGQWCEHEIWTPEEERAELERRMNR